MVRVERLWCCSGRTSNLLVLLLVHDWEQLVRRKLSEVSVVVGNCFLICDSSLRAARFSMRSSLNSVWVKCLSFFKASFCLNTSGSWQVTGVERGFMISKKMSAAIDRTTRTRMKALRTMTKRSFHTYSIFIIILSVVKTMLPLKTAVLI